MDLPLTASDDDVLAQPTRARLFATLAELKRAAGTAELAALLDLHPNGVRTHLERLEDAGLVTRTRLRQARGRPRDVWTVAPGARPGGAAPRGYAELGGWLARAMPSGRSSLRRVEAAGREIGREIAPAHASGPAAFQSALVALGFQPQEQSGRAGAVTVSLCNCPYRDAVRENQEVVCTLHRGMTRGLLDVLEPGCELAAFVPHDPDTAGCVIELEGVERS